MYQHLHKLVIFNPHTGRCLQSSEILARQENVFAKDFPAFTPSTGLLLTRYGKYYFTDQIKEDAICK